MGLSLGESAEMIKRVVLAVFGFVYALSAWAAPGGVYTFGVGPVQSSTELAKRWIPILRHLSAATGHELQFHTARDIPAFQTDVVAGTFDFVFINPYHYLQSHTSSGYRAFAREKDGALVGIVVARKDAALNDMAQLNGQAVAFPAPNALAATWLPMNEMRERHIEVKPNYVKSMDSVYLSVARGLFPAGGGELRTFNALAPETRDQLKIIWRAEPLPPFAFAAHPRVPRDVVEKVQAAMARMNTRPETMALLRAVNLAGVEKADDADYKAFREMNIKPPSIP
jgi:phosphonate transport system substrate-binding protein